MVDLSIADFLKELFSLVWKRSLLLAVLNLVYFCSILIGALLMQFLFWQRLVWPFGEYPSSVEDDPLVLFVDIFVSNLVLSAFVMVTLVGLAFFVLPFAVVCFRAVVWGMLIQQLPTVQFLAAFPTSVLEGVGYVLAAVAGMILGLSWLKPNWAFTNEELRRVEDLRKAWKECIMLYALVFVFLFVAAIVEVVTLVYLF